VPHHLGRIIDQEPDFVCEFYEFNTGATVSETAQNQARFNSKGSSISIGKLSGYQTGIIEPNPETVITRE